MFTSIVGLLIAIVLIVAAFWLFERLWPVPQPQLNIIRFITALVILFRVVFMYVPLIKL